MNDKGGKWRSAQGSDQEAKAFFFQHPSKQHNCKNHWAISLSRHRETLRINTRANILTFLFSCKWLNTDHLFSLAYITEATKYRVFKVIIICSPSDIPQLLFILLVLLLLFRASPIGLPTTGSDFSRRTCSLPGTPLPGKEALDTSSRRF